MAIAHRSADLHTHTTASDGLQPPAANVRMAKEAGLAAIAITDHDTVVGVAEAMAEGERIGITVVPGVEVSTIANGVDIHILGYYMDINDEKWLERLAGLRNTRDLRNDMIVDKLRSLGIEITMDDVRTAANGHSRPASVMADEASIGRPHIAAALLNKGIVSSMQEAFDHYLASGAAAYVNPPRITPYQAIDWIRKAGGTSVIAHPGLYGNDLLVEEIIKYGVQGIEVYHSDHGQEEEHKYALLASRNNLIVTGGSDFHGARQGVVFHGEIGNRTVDISVLEQLQLASANKK